MKILYLCNYYHRAMIFRDAMNKMEKLGHSVLAFNSVEFGEVIEEKYQSIMDDKVVHCECYKKNDRYLYHLKQYKIYNRIIEKVDVAEYDLIHCHTLFNGGWVARKIYKKLNVPYVVTVRNTDLNSNLKYPIFIPIARMIVKDAKKVIFLSESYRRSFIEKCYFGREREEIYKKTEVVLNGLESYWIENKWNESRECHKPLELLCVGKIDSNKNMKSVLEVTEQLNKEGIPTKLTVIGKVVDKRIKDVLDRSKYTEILAFMNKEDLINYYRKSDIYVMPSIHESFGRVYAEAMSQGLPVIYTRGQGFDGLFKDGEIGYSVNPLDIEEIKQSVKKIMGDYYSISHKCVDSVSIFEWERITNKLDKIYRLASCKGD